MGVGKLTYRIMSNVTIKAFKGTNEEQREKPRRGKPERFLVNINPSGEEI